MCGTLRGWIDVISQNYENIWFTVVIDTWTPLRLLWRQIVWTRSGQLLATNKIFNCKSLRAWFDVTRARTAQQPHGVDVTGVEVIAVQLPSYCFNPSNPTGSRTSWFWRICVKQRLWENQAIDLVVKRTSSSNFCKNPFLRVEYKLMHRPLQSSLKDNPS